MHSSADVDAAVTLQAEEAARLRDEFFANLSQELRMPTNASAREGAFLATSRTSVKPSEVPACSKNSPKLSVIC